MRYISRKGEIVGFQFNLVFMLIAGTLIVVFLFSSAQGIRKSNQMKLETESISKFGNVLNYLYVARGVESSTFLSDMEIVVGESDGYCDQFSIRGSPYEGASIAGKPVFSPKLMTHRILGYSRSWKMPFQSTSFVYLTCPDVAYVFVTSGDDEVARAYAIIPNISKRKVTNMASFENDNSRKVRFITSAAPAQMSPSLVLDASLDIDVLRIYPTQKRIEFHEWNAGAFYLMGEVFYFDDDMLMAAIYSEDADSYECNMIKAFSRLNRQSSLLRTRTGYLIPNLHEKCDSADYDDAIALLDQMESRTSSLGRSYDIHSRNIVSIAEQLEEKNNAIKEKGCPTIY